MPSREQYDQNDGQAGSGFGFIGGLVSRWRTDVAEALILCQKFPMLIEHHARISEVGRELEVQSFADWSKDMRWNPRKLGIAIAAMYSAAPALERLRQEEEDALVAMYVARQAEFAASLADKDS
ncbi:hypothetical protein N2152v2_011281 [Parachlorella kessleri]